MSSIPTPPVVPPMSPRVRDLLYGIFAWLALAAAATLVATGALTGLGVDVPKVIGLTAVTVQTVVGSVWGWLGFVAKANVPNAD